MSICAPISSPPILDGLVGEVARQDPDALRQVAATSPVEIARMSRLFDISSRLLGSTPTGPITAALALYVRSLQLFLDGFAEDAIGRPPHRPGDAAAACGAAGR